MTIHLDISQLLRDPKRSGIQRAERELIRHWPGPASLTPVRFDASSGAMHELPLAVFDILCAEAPPGGIREELALLEPHVARASPPIAPTRLLNAELFFDPARARYYRSCADTCRPYWLVYDFLPWLHPDWFAIGSAARLMPFLHGMQNVDDLAFISKKTWSDFVQRVGRRAVEPRIIPMGADGLGLEPQGFSPMRRTFVMLGTIEPRKNAAAVMLAFQDLWAAGHDARLVMIGATSPDTPVELALLKAMAVDPRFKLLRDLPDAGVRQALRGARAMLFPSEGEGYGIPPMEALHAGIPVIVSADLPALAGQPSLGQIRLAPASRAAIADAVARLLDDATAERLWADAAVMAVPGWADFAAMVADWVQA